MNITKTLTIKVLSLGATKVRADSSTVREAHRAAIAAMKPGDERPEFVEPEAKDGIAISLAAVDETGRSVTRKTITICEGKATVDRSSDLGVVPTELTAAINAAFSQIEAFVASSSITF